MADRLWRVPQNVPGRFYVDETCIYCALCVEMVPAVFAPYDEEGWAYVYRQPELPDEVRLTMEALEYCPTNSIGSDGD